MGKAADRGGPQAVRRAFSSAVVAAIAAALCTGCGLLSHDVTVSTNFTAGGGPSVSGQFAASDLTTPLAANAGDLSKLSSVTLQSVTLASTDTGDLSYVGPVSMTISANGLPDAVIASFAGSPPSGTNTVAFAVDSSKDLRPYLAASGVLKAVVTYAVQPVTARGLLLTLVVRGNL